jgi:hypothetical protein
MKNKAETGVFEVNELRQVAALPERDNGDVIMGPANLVPILDYATDYDDDGSGVGDPDDNSEPERTGKPSGGSGKNDLDKLPEN